MHAEAGCQCGGQGAVVGVSAQTLVFAIKLHAPKVPGALVAVILGIAATVVFGLGDMKVELFAHA